MKTLMTKRITILLMSAALLSPGIVQAVDEGGSTNKAVPAIPVTPAQPGTDGSAANPATPATPATPSAKALENRKGQQGKRMRKLHAKDSLHRDAHSMGAMNNPGH